MTDDVEKTDFRRMASDWALSVSIKEEHQSFEGHVVNLSIKGILFTSIEKFEAGASLDIVLTPSNSKTPPMEACVVVSRVIDNESVYEVACEIEKIW